MLRQLGWVRAWGPMRGSYLGRLGTASTSAGSASGRSAGDAVAWVFAFLSLCAAILLAPAVASAAGPPLIEASWVTGVTATGANLRADIEPNDLSTTYRFDYITDAAYQANLQAEPPREGFFGAAKVPPGAEAGIGSKPVPPVFQLLSNLSPATPYRYRAVATNSAATTIGPVRAFTTQQMSPTFRLPDNRAWELVSPVDKGGGAIAGPEELFGGGDIQAASAAPALTYGSGTAFGDPAGAPPASQYVSSRTASGWSTENVSTPLGSGAYGDEPDGAPYRVFSTDLSRALLFGGLPCRGGVEGCPAPNSPLPDSGAPAGYMAFYLRDNASGGFSSLLGAADVAHSEVVAQAFEVGFAAASADLSHVVLSSCAALTADATEILDGPGHCDPDAANLYRHSPSGLQAVNLLPGEITTAPGAAIAAPSGAVSSDGSRIYWTQGGNLFLREGNQSDQVDQAQGGGGTFQTATPSGSVAFFTKEGHLYRFDATTKVVSDLTPAGGVVGVLGSSASGGRVYFQDAGGLRLWDDGATVTVAPGAEAAAASDYPPATGTARVSDDGLHLAFLSTAELTGFDNTDAETGQRVSELFLYGPLSAGAPATLVCASCNPSGERPHGASTIPGALVNGTTLAYKPRALATDGLRLLFDSADELVEQDTNSRPDVYQWEASGVGDCGRSPGCVSLISSGRSPRGARFLDATASGADVFFITDESLLKIDPGSIDVYDARIGGGDLPEVHGDIICKGDACQPLPSPPDDPTPGTLTPNAGNPQLRIFEPRGKKQKKRHGKRRRKGHGKGANGRGGKRRDGALKR